MTTGTVQGLEDVVVAQSTKSLVDGIVGKLIYGGYRIEDLAENAMFEEVAYLLWHDRLPNAAELEVVRQAIADEAGVPDAVIDALTRLPRETNSMAAVRTAVSMLSAYDSDAENLTDKDVAQHKAIRLTGQITTICAAWARIRDGKDAIAPRRDLSLSQNFVYMITGEEPDQTASDAVNVYLVLLAEHGMNASTFTGRVITGTGSDMHSAIVGAIGALKGPAHGGANTAAMKTFLEIGDASHVEQWFETEVRQKKRRIMGIGHRVYKALDPRAIILKRHAEALAESTGNSRWFDIALKLEQTARADDYFVERNLYPNVDYYSAIVLYTLDLDVDMFTPLFVMARIAGWTAHVIEQMGGRLIRPKAQYTGQIDLAWVPLDQR